MATIRHFEDLEIWQHARILSNQVFRMTIVPPFVTDYKFRDQIRAAAGSVMDNIAEGFERASRREFIHFLSISKGSCGEVQSQLHRAHDQHYIPQQAYEDLVLEYRLLGRKLAGFISYLNATEIKGQKFKNRE